MEYTVYKEEATPAGHTRSPLKSFIHYDEAERYVVEQTDRDCRSYAGNGWLPTYSIVQEAL